MPKKTQTFTTIPHDHVPSLPMSWRICPTCLDPMMIDYCWKSSERVIHYFLHCHCGSRTKGKLISARINSRGELVTK